MFSILSSPLDLTALRQQMTDHSCGALVTFEGLVRNHHEGRDVKQLHYTHHPVLAQKEGERILSETLKKFPGVRALAVHRIGTLQIGDCAVITLTASAHRDAAFRANRFLIDSIKARVPIWKKESYANGDIEWTSPCPNCGPVNHSH